MVVVTDTGPLNYLILIGQIDILPRLYGRVLIPDVVLAELAAGRAPPVVSQWAAQLPDWIEVRPTPAHTEKAFRALDAGERAALLLVRDQPKPVLLLIDDMEGRRETSSCGIPVTGTLGILRDGAKAGWLDLSTSFADLRRTNFHAPVAVMDALLRADDRKA